VPLAHEIMCLQICKLTGTHGAGYDSFGPRAATAMERG
jgi:hypothetical protein